MTARTLAILSLAGVMEACIFVTDTCACTKVPPTSIVFGNVTTAAGAPAASAIVTVTVRERSCSGAVSEHNTLADDDGFYRLAMLTLTSSDTACLAVVARDVNAPPGQTVTASALVAVNASPPDSVRVNLQLP